MKSTFQTVFIFFCIYLVNSNNAFCTDGCAMVYDHDAATAIKKYQEAYNKADSDLIRSWSISQESYNGLLADLKKKETPCLSEFDKTYLVHAVVDEFNNTCKAASGFFMDSISTQKVSVLDGCGGVSYKKIDAKAYFNNTKTKFELPISLVLILEEKQNYKLMMQIVNYKIFQNAQ